MQIILELSFDGPLAQSVEHRTFNPLVVRSIAHGPHYQKELNFMNESNVSIKQKINELNIKFQEIWSWL